MRDCLVLVDVISLAGGAALEPGLLLFAAFVVRGLAEYATQ
jgi:hypothetical protein